MGKKHAKLVDEIKLHLESLPFSEVIPITPGTHGSMRSTSDIIACINGRFLAVEVKTENDTPTRGQIRFIKNVIKAKGSGFVTYSLEDTKSKLKYLGFVQ